MKARSLDPSAAGAPDVGDACRRLEIDLSSTQTERLATYVQLLLRWNTVYNLTAVRDPEKVWTHHVFDCLSAVGALRRHRAAHLVSRVLDVGSGAGMPGVVLGIAEPDLEIACVDCVGKKVAFIRQAVAELGLANVTAVHHRVETWHAAPFDLIASRAYASLLEFTSSTRHLLAEEGTWMAMKGRVPSAELAELGSSTVFHVEPLGVPGLDAERCIVWMRPS